ncbi:hypothetical protein SNEBB_010269 [Seison nebaliae]|nr:hypothetical protein SNEBB_010269 [Seison nebaliae]
MEDGNVDGNEPSIFLLNKLKEIDGTELNEDEVEEEDDEFFSLPPSPLQTNMLYDEDELLTDENHQNRNKIRFVSLTEKFGQILKNNFINEKQCERYSNFNNSTITLNEKSFSDERIGQCQSIMKQYHPNDVSLNVLRNGDDEILLSETKSNPDNFLYLQTTTTTTTTNDEISEENSTEENENNNHNNKKEIVILADVATSTPMKEGEEDRLINSEKLIRKKTRFYQSSSDTHLTEIDEQNNDDGNYDMQHDCLDQLYVNLKAEFNYYQAIVCLSVCPLVSFVAFQTFSSLFLFAEPLHRCQLNSSDTLFDVPINNLSIPSHQLQRGCYYSATYHNNLTEAEINFKSFLHNRYSITSTNQSVPNHEKVMRKKFIDEHHLLPNKQIIRVNINNNTDKIFIDRSTFDILHRCQSDLFSTKWYEFNLYRKWNLHCHDDRRHWRAHTDTGMFLGGIIGSLLAGVLSDRYGRRRVMIINLFVYVLFAIMAFIAPTLTMLSTRIQFILYVVTRIFVAMALEGVFIIPLTYCVEMVGPSSRSMMEAIIEYSFSLGEFFLLFVSWLCRSNWMAILLLVFLPILPFFVVFLFLPESPRWLILRRRYSEAKRVFRRFSEASSISDKQFETIWRTYLQKTHRRLSQQTKERFTNILADETDRYYAMSNRTRTFSVLAHSLSNIVDGGGANTYPVRQRLRIKKTLFQDENKEFIQTQLSLPDDVTLDNQNKNNNLEPIIEFKENRWNRFNHAFLRRWGIVNEYRRLFYRLTVVLIAWLVTSMMYYGIGLHADKIRYFNPYLTFLLMLLAELPGTIFCQTMLDRLGRKNVFSVSMGTAGTIAIVTGVLQKIYDYDSIGTDTNQIERPIEWIVLVTTLLEIATISVAYIVVYIHASELFPTEVRNTVLGLGGSFALIGSAIAPQLVSRIDRMWKISFIFGGSCVICSFFIFTLPETLNKAMPQSFRDANRII